VNLVLTEKRSGHTIIRMNLLMHSLTGKGSENVGITTLIHEIPYIKIFPTRHCKGLLNCWTNLQVLRLWFCKFNLYTRFIECAIYL
jgi:hypothetical protein